MYVKASYLIKEVYAVYIEILRSVEPIYDSGDSTRPMV